jgi:hypothetical protein
MLSRTDQEAAARGESPGAHPWTPNGARAAVLDLLVISDVPGEADQLQELLNRGGAQARCRQVRTFRDASAAVEGARPDAVLTRFRCGARTCLRFLMTLRR